MADFDLPIGFLGDANNYITMAMNWFSHIGEYDVLALLTVGFAIFVICGSIYGAIKFWEGTR